VNLVKLPESTLLIAVQKLESSDDKDLKVDEGDIVDVTPINPEQEPS